MIGLTGKALSGVKVLDMGSATMGPVVASILAAFGADAVRVESIAWPDIERISLPYKDGIPGVNRGGHFNMQHHSKYSIAIDLNKGRSDEVINRLIAWADVVIQTLSTNSRRHKEFNYERFQKINPGIVYMNATILGDSGPKGSYKGLGQHAAAMSGFYHLMGWPDRQPVGHPVAYTDFLALYIGATAIVAALNHRRSTGKGQSIELSAYEIGVTALRHVVLDFIANGHNQGSTGNRSSYAVPHGVYRCLGEDRWCALSVANNKEWEGLCRAMGTPGWMKDSKFMTALGRKANEDELDRQIEAYTKRHAAEEMRQKLQDNGVPAGVVNNSRDIVENNAYVKARELFWSLDHPEVGEVWAPFPMPKLSKTPAEVKSRAPCLGEHTEYVCRELLKMSDEEFVELIDQGVLS